MSSRLETLQKQCHHVAFINFGGIGDEILFSPVITEVRKYLPNAHFTLFLEDRSRSIQPLLEEIDEIIPLRIIGKPRWKVFLELLWLLRINAFNLVISSGSSPFIPLMLLLSGVRQRVGFQTGRLSKLCLSVEAPLNQRQYAADMYFSLAKRFLQVALGQEYTPPSSVLPRLTLTDRETLNWAEARIRENRSNPGAKTVMIHPGVSRVSIQKKIYKSWDAASWADLIKQLVGTEQINAFLVGGPDDADIIAGITAYLPETLPGFYNLYGQTKNLKQLAALMLSIDVLVSVDSAPMHLALGLHRPVVALFGPTDEKKLLPATDARFQAVTAESIPCRPCLWEARATSCDTPVCLDIRVDQVLAAVLKLLSQSG